MDCDLDFESQQHKNVIIHIDIDYYYAQVEEILNPELKTKPFGIQQRFHVVTSNYEARKYGIKKMTLVNDALKKCPELVLVNGEDLSQYKLFSNRIFELLHSFTDKVEKLGFDENYLDVTNEIEKQINDLGPDIDDLHMLPPIYPNEEAFNKCDCGCAKRLMLGSHLASKIREEIFKQTSLTCSVGVSHNKLLAKLVGNMNKPNSQTVLAPMAATTYLAELNDLRTITGIGSKTASRIQEELSINTIEELQNCDMERLKKKFGIEMAQRLKDMSLGNDTSSVKPSGKPKSVGCEDSCKPISIRADAEEKFRVLLVRLITQITDDDQRIPVTIKVTIRKYDPVKKTSVRETKQCNILPSLFRNVDGKILLTDGGNEKLLKTIMNLFDRMIDMKIQFNITLLGLCFSKFQERKKGTGSIANFLMKKSDVEVQSITNISNESISLVTNGSFDDSFRCKTSSPLSVMDFETMSNNSLDFSGSESELEPSPKKKKLNLLFVARRRCSNDDLASPSKLRVSDLRLNSMDCTDSSFNKIPISPLCLTNEMEPSTSKSIPSTSSSSNKQKTQLPASVDATVFQELPLDVQRELLLSWQAPNVTPIVSSKNAKKSNTIHKYFIKNS